MTMTGNAADPTAGARVTPRAWLAALVLTAGWPGVRPLPAAVQAPATVVGGLVNRETRAPVEGARVAILGSSLSTSTDSAGLFRLTGIAPGVRVIQVRAIGFAVGSWLLQVDEGQTQHHAFELEPRLYELAAVTVPGRDHDNWRDEAGFERRRERSAGYFITRSDIASRRPANLTDLLRGVPGLYTTCRSRSCQVTMIRSTRPCTPEYFLDGHPATFATGPSFPINQVRGVEIYRSESEVPMEFRRSGVRCGVIAIWSIEPGESLRQPPGSRAAPDSQARRLQP